MKRFFAELARGCICPPEIPVCVCGHEPEAELLAKRAVKADGGRDRAQSALAARRGCAWRESSATQEVPA